jgi:DNA mismatch repair protein MSH4
MDFFYSLSDYLANIDMILSFVNYATKTTCTKPSFGQNLKLISASHPILNYHKQKDEKQLIKNTIETSPSIPFNLIMGANTSGKSTIIKQLALLQVMAQCNFFKL